jgi:DNA-binding NarL/FixJ family response regulator
MNHSSQALHLPGLNNFPGELFMQDDKIKMVIQGSMWTLTPDILTPDDINVTVKLPFVSKGSFTKIQIDVLTLIGKGYTDKEIADKLCISIHALRHRKDSISLKAGIERKRQLSALAQKLGLV